MTKFLCDKAAMLDEYFGVVISEVGKNLRALPLR
jgi:hypothetical protein